MYNFDKKGNGVVDFEEFMVTISELIAERKKSKVRHFF